MNSDTNASSGMEGEYPGLEKALDRYLTGERMVDDVLDHPDCQREIGKMCRGIAGNADKGADLSQSLNTQILRRESEGPLVAQTRERARSLRTRDLHTLEEFFAYVYVMARNLDRSGRRKSRRRSGKVNIVPDPIDQLPVASKEVSPEERLLQSELFGQIGDMPEPQRLALLYWAMYYDTRVIADILSRTGYPCSHVTVQKWIKDALTKLRGEPVLSIRRAS